MEEPRVGRVAVADALGFERFSVIGQSMGGSVAIKAAELDGRRLDAVVLLDVAGRVDPGVGAVIASVISGLDEFHDSVEGYLAAVKARGIVRPWSEYWDRCHRYGLAETDGGVRSSVHLEAAAEDRLYTLTQDPYDRWKYLTMPTLLLRATQQLRPGAGHVVLADDREHFKRQVLRSEVVEIDANHLTIRKTRGIWLASTVPSYPHPHSRRHPPIPHRHAQGDDTPGT